MKVSVVAPVMNEAQNLGILVDRVMRALDGAAVDEVEFIIVDDGSTDSTWEALSQLCAKVPQLRGIRLSRNFGHQKALYAGLSATDGDAVISMDGDLQHPPEMIPKLIEQWRNGYSVVLTRRMDEQVTSSAKRLTSSLFYKFFSWLAEVELSPGSSDFRLMDRRSLNSLLSCGDSHLFLRGAVQWVGFKHTRIPYQVGARLHGQTKYTLRKMLSFAGSAIVSFSNKPLRIAIWIGVATAFLAFAELAYIVVRAAQGVTVPGWASTVGILSLLFGVLFILIGILGAYIGSIHQAAQGRPLYVVREEVGGPLSTSP